MSLTNDQSRQDNLPINNDRQDAEKQDLEKAVDNAHDILIRAESVFPFALFPDTITVSRMKVTITRRAFFNTSDVVSLQIEDILNVEVDTGPFFGSLNVFTRIYGTDPLRISFLSRKNAKDIQQILEGYIIAGKQGINTADIGKEELIILLMRLGSESNGSTTS